VAAAGADGEADAPVLDGVALTEALPLTGATAGNVKTGSADAEAAGEDGELLMPAIPGIAPIPIALGDDVKDVTEAAEEVMVAGAERTAELDEELLVEEAARPGIPPMSISVETGAATGAEDADADEADVGRSTSVAASVGASTGTAISLAYIDSYISHLPSISLASDVSIPVLSPNPPKFPITPFAAAYFSHPGPFDGSFAKSVHAFCMFWLKISCDCRSVDPSPSISPKSGIFGAPPEPGSKKLLASILPNTKGTSAPWTGPLITRNPAAAAAGFGTGNDALKR